MVGDPLFVTGVAILCAVLACRTRGGRLRTWALLEVAAVGSFWLAGFVLGVLNEEPRYGVVLKERTLVAAGMQEMERQMRAGRTDTVLLAVRAFNRAAKADATSARYYLAALELVRTLDNASDR